MVSGLIEYKTKDPVFIVLLQPTQYLTTQTQGLMTESVFHVQNCYSTSIRKMQENIVSQMNPQ